MRLAVQYKTEIVQLEERTPYSPKTNMNKIETTKKILSNHWYRITERAEGKIIQANFKWMDLQIILSGDDSKTRPFLYSREDRDFSTYLAIE
ncbi:hypothetical protein TNCV_4853391 [Trichonephila clavipes]|nr:hypothetical protein TNCV_4853391 [Trichonephila clavipes]